MNCHVYIFIYVSHIIWKYETRCLASMHVMFVILYCAQFVNEPNSAIVSVEWEYIFRSCMCIKYPVIPIYIKFDDILLPCVFHIDINLSYFLCKDMSSFYLIKMKTCYQFFHILIFTEKDFSTHYDTLVMYQKSFLNWYHLKIFNTKICFFLVCFCFETKTVCQPLDKKFGFIYHTIASLKL